MNYNISINCPACFNSTIIIVSYDGIGNLIDAEDPKLKLLDDQKCSKCGVEFHKHKYMIEHILENFNYCVIETSKLEDFDAEEWNNLGEEDGNGSFCHNKRMVEKGNSFICLFCGNIENSSS